MAKLVAPSSLRSLRGATGLHRFLTIQARGEMDALRDRWENSESVHQSSMQFVEKLRMHLRHVSQLAQEALGQTQQQQTERNNRKVRVR